MEVHDFIQKLEELMGYKVKIKFTHTTKGNTWELTVKGQNEDEVIPIIKRADRAMRDFTKEMAVEYLPMAKALVKKKDPIDDSPECSSELHGEIRDRGDM